MTKRIALIHGPNLNLLGQRDADTYGSSSLAELEHAVQAHAKQLDVEIRTFQSNVEGELINALHEAQEDCFGVIFNPGGTATRLLLCAMRWMPLPSQWLRST